MKYNTSVEVYSDNVQALLIELYQAWYWMCTGETGEILVNQICHVSGYFTNYVVYKQQLVRYENLLLDGKKIEFTFMDSHK